MLDGEGRRWFTNWVEYLEINVGNVEEEIKGMGDYSRGVLEEMGEAKKQYEEGETRLVGWEV